METDRRLARVIARVRERLAAGYGVPRRPRVSAEDALVQTILSQNTSDVNSGRTFAALKTRFPDWDELARADARAIVAAIKAGGLAAVKAGYLKAAARALLAERGGFTLAHLKNLGVAEAEAYLTALPGVGAKTARVVLLFAFGRDVFPVDTHILRLTRRLGYVGPRAGAAAAHRFWDRHCPRGAAFELHLNLIRHGREVCHARRPECPACCLNDLCPSCGAFS
jgi:endonuclease-3